MFVAATKTVSEINSTPTRVSLDQVIAFALCPIVLVILAILCPIVLICQGRPFLFASERMRAPGQAFTLLKIRTMQPPLPGEEEAVLGGHQALRVTRIGAALRRSRLDELPQIFNVIRGDIRFIGPRPPLRRYVEAYPELYSAVLRDTVPGITGLATVMLHRREEKLLAVCKSSEEADLVYRRRCIPLKARLDLIYCDNRCLRLDVWILIRTVTGLRLRMTELCRPATPDCKQRECVPVAA